MSLSEPLFPRRQPCPCGSGRKFKDCCEPDAAGLHIDADVVLRAERNHPGVLHQMIDGFTAEIERRTAHVSDNA